MRRKSYINSEGDLGLLDDLFLYTIDNPISLEDDFFGDNPSGVLLQRREFTRIGYLQDRYRRNRLRLFRVYTPFLWDCVLGMKVKISQQTLRKFVINNSACSLISSSPLRVKSSAHRKLAFNDFISVKGFYYTWYNMYSKKRFFFKNKAYKQLSLPLKKGCDLFVLGHADITTSTHPFFSEEYVVNLFLYKDFQFDFIGKDIQNTNICFAFDLYVQHLLECYKLLQLLFFNVLK